MQGFAHLIIEKHLKMCCLQMLLAKEIEEF